MTLPGLDAPLATIWCVGRNYAAHAKELGNPVPAEPVIFLKPQSAVVLDGGTLPLPKDSARVDHEVELVVGLGKGKVPVYAVGIDFTARDVQDRLKKEGLPWTLAKARRGFAAVGPFAVAALPQTLTLTVNGETRQKGSTQDMLFDVPALLGYLDKTFGLAEGDLVFTGTPPGVGPLKAGDRIEASLGTVSRLRLTAA
jgi:2-keto-4-pentenoate hydratase/2-oxohepta-3-ene-1,7-dioic acid hydratase in catechol pathway